MELFFNLTSIYHFIETENGVSNSTLNEQENVYQVLMNAARDVSRKGFRGEF